MYVLSTVALTLVCPLELSISTYTWGTWSTGCHLLCLNSPHGNSMTQVLHTLGAYNIYDDISSGTWETGE